MSAFSSEDQVFENVDYTEKQLPKGQYEVCTFINCNFSETELSHIAFTECEFRSCNLSMIKVINTTWNDTRFSDCKMLGIDFEQCNEHIFSVAFENCTLNYSSFFKRMLKKTRFTGCALQEADFTGSDCSAAVFHQCDLRGAKFENTNLEKADFRTAANYSIDPALNKMKKAQFSFPGIAGLLDKYDIVIT